MAIIYWSPVSEAPPHLILRWPPKGLCLPPFYRHGIRHREVTAPGQLGLEVGVTLMDEGLGEIGGVGGGPEGQK